MSTWKVSKLCFMALLLVVFVAGCGREQGTVAPTLSSVTGIVPNRGTQGQTLGVTLTGTNFTAGATVNVSGTLVTASNTAVVSSTQITATFTIAATAALGARNVTVTTSGATTNAVTFTVDPALTVTSTTPTNGATDVPINQVLTATFSQALSCATVTTSTFTVLALTAPRGAVAGTVTCSGATATFTPTSLLASNAGYAATLTTGIMDSQGDPMLNAYVWGFTTAPIPTVISTIPTNGATHVPIDQVLAATFSEAMNCATITASTFTLTGPSGAVAGTVACSGSGPSATFTPTRNLAANAAYTATITTGVTNVGGAALASNYLWSFRTFAAPTVISTIPMNGATGVPINQVLAATFSQAMNCSTVTSSTFTLAGLGGAVAGTVVCSDTTATFTPTSKLAANTVYTATITTGVTNATGEALASNYGWSFTTAPAPTVISTIPTKGATGVPVNQVLAATFSQDMNCATVTTSTFTLTGLGGAVVGTIACSGTSATFTPTSLLASNTTYTATITTGVADGTGEALASNYVWSFTTTARPTVISTIPTNGATYVPIDQVLTATFSEAMSCPTVTTSTFTLTGPGGAVVGTVACSGTSATFTATSLLASSTTYTATITTGATNAAGAPLASNYVWSFTTAPAPTVTSTIPATAATEVPINQVLTATFSEAVKCSTVTTSTFTLKGPGGGVAGTVACSGTSATFTPTSFLKNKSTYTATITTGVTNRGGAALASNYVWSYTTTARPTVISTVPTNGATGVPVNQVLTAAFSEALSCSTVTSSTFSLTGLGGAVAGTVVCLGTSATFTPTSLLASNAGYTATLTTGITDPQGDSLLSNYVWSFTTALAPTVTSTIPTNGAIGVPINQVLTATFNQAMNCATVTSSTFTLSGPGGAVAGTVICLGTSATFTPKSLLAVNVDYKATITTGAANVAGAALASNYVWTFTTELPPTVTSTAPTNGATGVPVNQVLTATFSEDMNCATLTTSSFTLSGLGGAVVGTVACSGTTATFTPTSLLAPLGTYTAMITTGATNEAGAPLATNYVWSFTTVGPFTVTFTIPANGATGVPIDQALTAGFSQLVKCSTVTSSSFTLTRHGVAVAGTVACLPTSATFTPTGDLAIETTYTATLTTAVTDSGSIALASNYVWSFKTGTTPGATPPTVTAVTPLNLATGVPLNTAITAMFDEAMAPATMTTSTFTLTGPGATSVKGVVTFNPITNIVTLTPTSNLAPLTSFTATVTTGVTNLSGTAMAANFVWTFRTGAAPDTTPPTVLSTNPANLATDVPANQVIAATFDKAMNDNTINTTTFTLFQGATPVPGVVAYIAVGDTAIFIPNSNLEVDKVYTATITTGVTDLAGNHLVSDYVWSFTTVAPVITPPKVVSTNPANNAKGVCFNATINATFSKAMDPATITTATFTVTAAGVPVIGTISLDVTGTIATFTPTSNLAPSTSYTATITTGVTDLAGNHLLSDYVWMFTTGSAACTPPPACLTLCGFGSFGGSGGSGMTNSGIFTVINGDIGTTSASTLITGFHDTTEPYIQFTEGCIYTETTLNVGAVNGEIYTAPPPPTTLGCPNEGTAATWKIAAQAAADALALFNATSPASMPCTAFCAYAGELGGLTLTPGIYESAPGTFKITNGDLTLDGQGNANAVWVFQAATSLTVGLAALPRSVTLINGAQAKNVFWHIGSAATINGSGGGTMVGTIVAQAAITFSTAGNVAITTLNGRAIGLTAVVTMVNTHINVPAP